MANAEHTNHEVQRLQAMRSAYTRRLEKAATWEEWRDLDTLCKNLDERIAAETNPPASPQPPAVSDADVARMLSDRRPASRAYVTKTAAALATAMAPIIQTHTNSVVAPLQNEIADLRTRIAALERRAGEP
jgi:hypothetical protein